MRACSIKNITQLTKSDSKTNYKRDLINCNNLDARLTACGFDIKKCGTGHRLIGFDVLKMGRIRLR